jgi:hypothetical protein
MDLRLRRFPAARSAFELDHCLAGEAAVESGQ